MLKKDKEGIARVFYCTLVKSALLCYTALLRKQIRSRVKSLRLLENVRGDTACLEVHDQVAKNFSHPDHKKLMMI